MLILDTSTLILLAKADLLSLLIEKTRVWIPEEVRVEAVAKPQRYDAQLIAELVRAGSIRVATLDTRDRQRRQLEGDFNLGPGEAAALLLAKARGVPLGTDDGPAIKAAKILGVPFLTAIHVLTELHARGRLNRKAAIAKLDALQQVGRYSARIVEDARRQLPMGR